MELLIGIWVLGCWGVLFAGTMALFRTGEGDDRPPVWVCALTALVLLGVLAGINALAIKLLDLAVRTIFT